jgi:hypothetical protein
MPKMKLGGVKALEKHAYLTSMCRSAEDTLGDICSRLAADRINLSLLTHVADTGAHESTTNASTEGTDGFSSYVHWKEIHGECSIGKLLPDISLVSIFPHDQKPGVTGLLIGVLSRAGIMPRGFASSPSAITTVLSPSDLEGFIGTLFDDFEVRAYTSALDWQSAYRNQGKPVKEVLCSYQEEIIKIYNIAHHTDLDLWCLALPLHRIGDFGKVLLELDELQLKMPFLVSNCSPDKPEIYFSFCVSAAHRNQVKQVLVRNLTGLDSFCLGPVFLLFLLGPHFGDRYGIANTLLRVLRNAGIPLLALSYTVSSFSLVIRGSSPDLSIAALYSNFQIPGRKP